MFFLLLSSNFFLSAFFYLHFFILIFPSASASPHPPSAGIRSSFYKHPFSTGFTREFKQRCFSANHVNWKWSFWTLRPYFEQIRGQIVSIRVKSFSKTNLVASRYIKREKRSLPVDVRCSRRNVVSATSTVVRRLNELCHDDSCCFRSFLCWSHYLVPLTTHKFFLEELWTSKISNQEALTIIFFSLVLLLGMAGHGIKTWKSWRHFFKSQSISILTIRSNRRQETVSMPKYSLE